MMEIKWKLLFRVEGTVVVFGVQGSGKDGLKHLKPTPHFYGNLCSGSGESYEVDSRSHEWHHHGQRSFKDCCCMSL